VSGPHENQRWACKGPGHTLSRMSTSCETASTHAASAACVVPSTAASFGGRPTALYLEGLGLQPWDSTGWDEVTTERRSANVGLRQILLVTPPSAGWTSTGQISGAFAGVLRGGELHKPDAPCAIAEIWLAIG
jgi:hypothetical protein